MASIVRKAPLGACCITLDDVKQLYMKLKESVADAAEYEIKQLRGNSWVGNDKDASKEFLDTYKVSVVINGASGQTLVDTSDKVFESPNLPDGISNIYFDSSSTYECANKRKPMQYFIVNLDFTKPPLIDFLSHSALPTPNNSFVEVHGESENWVCGVFETVQMKVRGKANRRSWLHRPYIYDLLIWAIAIPFSFYALNRLEPFLTAVVPSNYIKIGALVYGFIFILSGFRILFGYTKWAFPKLELIYTASRTIAHRRWWFAIITGVVAGILVGFRI